MKNYNHSHVHSGSVISGTHAASITVGDLRDALAEYPDDAKVIFGSVHGAGTLMFNRFKSRGDDLLQMEFDTDSD